MMRCVSMVAAVFGSATIALGQEASPAAPPLPPAPFSAQVPEDAGKQQAPAQPTLKVGDKAPALVIEKWVKGEPVAAYEPGRIYIVEFWATWCRPCIVTMPHLTRLQQKYKDRVRVIAVTALDSQGNSLEAVEAMVREKGDEAMGYAVAWDKGSATRDAVFKAAGQASIPCSLVIDGDGRVAYIGHPLWLEGPLERLTKGESSLTHEEQVAKLQERYKQVSAAMGKDPKAALELLAAFEKDYPATAEMFEGQKYGLLIKTGDARAVALGQDMYESAVKLKDGSKLGTIARAHLDPNAAKSAIDLGLALKAAEKTVEFTEGKSAAALLTLAQVYTLRGEEDKAIELRKRAIALSKSPAPKPDGDQAK